MGSEDLELGSVFAQIAITEYHRLTGLNDGNFSLISIDLRPKVPTNSVSQGGNFFVS